MLIHDRQITISSAGGRKAIRWPAQTLYWSEMVEKLKTPVRGTETMAEYLALPKSKQDDLKDVGGFVAGSLIGDRRKAHNVSGRDILTLDLDNITPGGTADTLRRLEALGCAYAVYSTRKHDEGKPRLRVLLPCNRTTTADEYEPLGRKLASIIGIELCDPTTFEASRLMYWPSCCASSSYVYYYGDKPFLDVDGLLAMYTNWRNVAEWAQMPGIQQAQVKRAAQQGDPTSKAGVVGAFCKIYDVYKAMAAFLPGEYVECDDGSGRYTFSGGSTVGGAVVYDNGNFLYSHHATDPTSGKLVNAFDLVRLHKFADKDDEAKPDTPTNKLPSYTAMREYVISDTHVAAILNQERYDRATQDFGNIPEDHINWISMLAISPTTGKPAKTADNVLIVLSNDSLLKGKLAYDEFANRGVVLGTVPWDSRTETRRWTDVDDDGLYWYMEKTYDIATEKRILAATSLCAHKYTFNEVRDYLTGLQWDGIKRLDTLLSDYLGAKDTIYSRAVIRKSLVAGVARVMTPGCKYDYMPILAGPQGLGKSTFLRILGKQWYSDSLQTFEGKEASEMIQGIWINELGELNGLSKSETNAVKQFLSRTEDIYREPFGRRTGCYPRRCIFFGTTNDIEFLKDRTGNRRFWPVDVGVQPVSKNVFTQLEEEVSQIWAEAFCYWQLGEPLYLRGEVEAEAMQEQELHRESNAKEGVIREFVDRQVPVNWEKRTLSERLTYWGSEFARSTCETTARDRICALEIWCECLGGDLKFMKRSDSLELNGILAAIPGWGRYRGRFGWCQQQKGFRKS